MALVVNATVHRASSAPAAGVEAESVAPDTPDAATTVPPDAVTGWGWAEVETWTSSGPGGGFTTSRTTSVTCVDGPTAAVCGVTVTVDPVPVSETVALIGVPAPVSIE